MFRDSSVAVGGGGKRERFRISSHQQKMDSLFSRVSFVVYILEAAVVKQYSGRTFGARVGTPLKVYANF